MVTVRCLTGRWRTGMCTSRWMQLRLVKALVLAVVLVVVLMLPTIFPTGRRKPCTPTLPKTSPTVPWKTRILRSHARQSRLRCQGRSAGSHPLPTNLGQGQAPGMARLLRVGASEEAQVTRQVPGSLRPQTTRRVDWTRMAT